MNTPACFLPSGCFHCSSSRPAKHGTKRFFGGTALLLFLLVPGSSALAQTPLAPRTLSFGNQAVNQPSAAMSATLKNTQAVPLSISSIAISGGTAAADYVAGGNCPLRPSTLGPGENCRITVTFTPSAPGMRTATLTLTDDAHTSLPTVSLTGIGVAPVDLSSWNIGAVAVGNTSATPSGTLPNDQNRAPTPSGMAPTEKFARGRPGTPKLPSRASGGPIVVPPSGAGNADGLISLAVTPANPSIASGQTQQFTATGLFSSGSTQNLTAFVTWSSSAAGVATINAAGLASGVSAGSTTIIATFATTTSPPPQPLAGLATGVIPRTPIIVSPPVSGGGSISSASTTLTVTADFVLTGSLTTPRYHHTATLLNNGLVLMAGGVDSNNNPSTSAELYGPTAGTFTPTGSLYTRRYQHTATLLNNGMVLIAGGLGSSGYLSSAELYNPATGTFTTLTNTLNTARAGHTATLLNNGMVLMAGGYNGGFLASAELYDPATGTFTTLTNTLNTARAGHTATLLNNSMVLIAGGYNSSSGVLASAELYNPATGTFTPTGSLNPAPYLHTATLLNNGMVLIAGGQDSSFNPSASAELYNPATGTFTTAGSLNTARQEHTATLLNNGMVLIAGGYNINIAPSYLTSAELYDPATEAFTATGSLNTAREVHTATLLNDGTVLMAGGVGSSGALSRAELYEPATLTPPNLVSISLSPSSPTVPLGSALRFIATGAFSEGSTEQLAEVTWSASNPAVISISDDASNLGAAYAAGAGSATLSACAGAVCGSMTVTVGPPLPVSIAVTPANGMVPVGLSVQLHATGTYNDGTTQDLTSSVTWTSSGPGVATINTAGDATGLSIGSTTITAALGAVQGSTTLMVTAPALVSIAVTPANFSIAAGTTQQFTATGTYSDGSTQNLMGAATWSSSAAGVA
ncbi:MAG: kelch repeat-containing protein, partial [Terriglobia bacterium]